MSNYEILKKRHRLERENWPNNLSVRIHRALSWLHKAELSGADEDSSFIFYWVAFNAAYANEIKLPSYYQDTQSTFNLFLEKLYELDEDKNFEKLIWKEFSQCIRVLLNNKFIHKQFWDYMKGSISEEEWKASFEKSKTIASKALGAGNTTLVLSIILSRIYILRNQLIHGGATWNSEVNRDQIRDCNNFMKSFVPPVIEIMMDNPEELWGSPRYPVIL